MCSLTFIMVSLWNPIERHSTASSNDCTLQHEFIIISQMIAAMFHFFCASLILKSAYLEAKKVKHANHQDQAATPWNWKISGPWWNSIRMEIDGKTAKNRLFRFDIFSSPLFIWKCKRKSFTSALLIYNLTQLICIDELMRCNEVLESMKVLKKIYKFSRIFGNGRTVNWNLLQTARDFSAGTARV